MDNSVNSISKLLAFLLKITSIAAIIFTAVYTLKDFTYLSDASSYNDFEFLGFIFAAPFVFGFIIVRIIAGVIIIIEMILKDERAETVAKIEPYDIDWKFTLKGIFGVIINVIVLGIFIIIAVVELDTTVEESLLCTFAVCFFAYEYKVFNKWLACLEDDDVTDDTDDEEDDEV